MNSYYFGEAVRIHGSFYDSDGALSDPADPSFYVRCPCRVENDYVYGVSDRVKKESTGIYYMDIITDEHGVYIYRAYSKSALITSSDEEEFFVK